MDSIVQILVGSSTTLDVYVLVRIIVLMLLLDFFAVICGYLGGLKR